MISLRQPVFDLRRGDLFFICSQRKNESMRIWRAQVERGCGSKGFLEGIQIDGLFRNFFAGADVSAGGGQ
jgi:hypothetical protein